MNKLGKRYTRQFKEDAVRLLVTSGKPVKELAEELGTTDVSLHKWKRQALSNELPPKGEKISAVRIDPSVLEQENLRLRKEL